MSDAIHRSESPFGKAASSWAHHADLVMYARRVLGDRSDTAEDVVQEAYLRLLGLAASDEAPQSARPWLFRVVRNLAIDERRSVARRADPVADTAILGAAARDDTATLVEQREEIASALKDISNLPPKERRAIEMDQAGIGAQQIAEELGTTPNAVHQALFRARKRLRGARAVAWGLVPIGVVPALLKLSDPALAVSLTNLPPGMPVGRALPVAGLVAAAMVSGSVVAPNISEQASGSEGIQFSIPAVTIADDVDDDSNRGSSSNSGPGDNSGPGSANSGRDRADDEDDESGQSQNRNRNRNRGSGGDSADDRPDEADDGSRNRRGRGSGSSGGSTAPSVGDDADDDASSGGNSGKGKSGAGAKAPSADDGPDSPDEPDSPDDSDND